MRTYYASRGPWKGGRGWRFRIETSHPTLFVDRDSLLYQIQRVPGRGKEWVRVEEEDREEVWSSVVLSAMVSDIMRS